MENLYVALRMCTCAKKTNFQAKTTKPQWRGGRNFIVFIKGLHNLHCAFLLLNSRISRCVEALVTIKCNTSLVALGALAQRQQHHTTWRIQIDCQGTPKWMRGLETAPTLGYWAHRTTYVKQVFLILHLTRCILQFASQVLNLTLHKSLFQKSLKNQPSGEGGTRSPPATPHRLQRRPACNAPPPTTPHHLQRRTACNAAPPATPLRLQRLQNQKWLSGGPKMADRVYPQVFGRSKENGE